MPSHYKSSAQSQEPGPEVERLAFRPAEAAEALGVSVTHIYRLLQNGDIRARRCGSRLLVSRRALEDYLHGEAS